MGIQSAVEEMCRELAPYFEEQHKHIFRAVVLDSNGQQVSTGEGVFDADQACGVFWPDTECVLATDPHAIAFVKHSDGRKIAVKNFAACPSVGSPHYHFDTK